MAEGLDTRRLFLAAFLSLGVLLLWQWVFPPSPPATTGPGMGTSEGRSVRSELEEPREAGLREDTSSSAAGEEARETTDRELLVSDRSELVEIETDRLFAQLTNRGGQLISLRLLDIAERWPAQMGQWRDDYEDVGVRESRRQVHHSVIRRR